MDLVRAGTQRSSGRALSAHLPLLFAAACGARNVRPPEGPAWSFRKSLYPAETYEVSHSAQRVSAERMPNVPITRWL